MGRLVRAFRSYAARRFLPLGYVPEPPPRRPRVSDAAVVMRDFHIVLNDLSVASHRVLEKHNREQEQGELFTG